MPFSNSSAARSDDTVDHLSEELRIHEQAESFEKAWQSGEPPNLDDYLKAEGVDRLGLVTELVRVDLEQRLRRGEAVRVESYLERYPELGQSSQALVDLVVWEHRVRRSQGEQVHSDEIQNRFPDHAVAFQARIDVPPVKLPPQALRLNCPHCHNPIEVLAEAEEDILCPSCGSTFRVDNQQTRTWDKSKLPKLGKFELLNRLGFGAFGTVYKAFDSELKRSVALKLPRSGTIVDQEDEERFLREARSAAQLRHSGIVPIFEVGRSQRFLYIVSELVEGITLADALSAKRLSFRDSAKLIQQVAEALDYSHKQGVVHRDLKPSNIMLSGDGTPRIMDFGLAKRETGEVTMTVEGQVLGTPAYMSPELAAGKAHEVDGRSDVYSLGVILYELLTGELPFRGNQRMLMHQVMHDEPRAPRSLNDRIPRDLEAICLKCLEKESRLRFPSGLALADDLTRFLQGHATLARPIGPVRRFWRWYQHHIVTVAAASSILTAGFVGLIVVGLLLAIVAARLMTGSAKTLLQSESTMIRNNFLMVFLFALLPAYVAVRSGFSALQGRQRGLWGTTLVIAFWSACGLILVLEKFQKAMHGLSKDVGIYFAHSLLFDITALLWLSICFTMQVYALLATRRS